MNDRRYLVVLIKKAMTLKYTPTEIPLLAHSSSAASTMSLRWMALGPLLTALLVITTFGLQSMILCARDSEENPAKTT